MRSCSLAALCYCVAKYVDLALLGLVCFKLVVPEVSKLVRGGCLECILTDDIGVCGTGAEEIFVALLVYVLLPSWRPCGLHRGACGVVCFPLVGGFWRLVSVVVRKGHFRFPVGGG